MSENNYSKPIPVVRLIILDSSGRALILRRGPGFAEGLWCLPGGKIDYGDTVDEAAARELEEETSLHATSIRFLFYQDSLPPTSGAMHCINLYLECMVEGELVLNDESVEAQWIGPEDLPRYAITFRNDEGLIRYWRECSGR